MELSKKVGYIKGLMAGLNISDSTPEGKVLYAMSELLEEMADEIETNAQLIDELGMFIDDLDEYADCLDDDLDDLDDIPVQELDHDPAEITAAADPETEKLLEEAAAEYDKVLAEAQAVAAAQQAEESDELVEGDALEDLSGLDELELIELPPSEEELSEPAAPAEEPPAPEPAPAAEERLECQCPECGNVIPVTQADLARGSIFCGNCGVELRFE